MFHNIFRSAEKLRQKKAKETKESKPKIIVDIHEKDSMIIPLLCELGCEVETRPLKVGDYLIGDILIERKTFSDFISSMISRRLIEQLRHLRQAKRALLIIENYDIHSEKLGKINPNSIRGFILSIILNSQIPIIFTEDSEETAMQLKVLAKQQLKPSEEISLHSRIPKTKKERQEYIVESFPGIGPKTAKKLLEKFKTIKNIINAKKEELEEILKSKTEDFLSLLE